ncbi:MAG TPA: methyl-accepting chemotaxis protein [Thiobacillaceae bacterium]|nr:methyl-accepting chemotaxis protein [Thiobacillaceae bacterium]
MEIKDINSALQEQRVASSDIARHVEGIAQMAESNGHSVKHMAEAVRNLEDLSGHLDGLVSRFRI